MSKPKSICEQIIDTTHSMGNKLNTKWEVDGDLHTASAAIKAYGTAINAAKAMVIYQKENGKTRKIKFFES